jgi:hypothetical protein
VDHFHTHPGQSRFQGLLKGDPEHQFAALNDIIGPEGYVLFAEWHAVEQGPVRTSQIADDPAPVGGNHFGMAAADRGIVQHDVQVVGHAADEETLVRFPAKPFEFGTEPREDNA